MGRSLSSGIWKLLRRKNKERDYQIGRHKVTLPPEHKLDLFQKRWTRYDVALSDVARLISEKYPTATAIDIGANVGDTAAAIRRFVDMPVLCVEGNKNFLPYLKKNTFRMGSDVSVEESFVGNSELTVHAGQVSTQNGTASIAPAKKGMNEKNAESLRDLSSILDSHKAFSQPRLIKIDTDGFDFAIICHARNLLAELKPVLFFEYYLAGNPNEEDEEREAIDSLFASGYEKHLVYDNFGNFLISVDARERFDELNSFLRSNHHNGVAIYYLDICSFSKDDEDIFNSLRNFEIRSVPKLRKAG